MTMRPLEEASQICPTTAQRRIAEGAVLVDVREQAEIGKLESAAADLIGCCGDGAASASTRGAESSCCGPAASGRPGGWC